MRLYLSSLRGILLLSSYPLFAAQDLGTLGGSYSFARDINAVGTVVGESTHANGETHAFIWKDGLMQDLGTLPHFEFSMANGLNDKGEIVGYARPSANKGLAQAVLWKEGKKLPLKPLLADEYSQASEINENGDIIGVNGTKAVVWRKGIPKALPGLGGEFSIALGISDKGKIVGNCRTSLGEVHACLWTNDEVVDLGTLGGRFSSANAVNDSGQVVGSSETANGEVHAFVWENGIMLDLGAGMIRNTNRQGVFCGEAPYTEITQAGIWFRKSLTSRDRLPDTVYSSLFSINDAGIAVGVSEIKPEGMLKSEFHATIWE